MDDTARAGVPPLTTSGNYCLTERGCWVDELPGFLGCHFAESTLDDLMRGVLQTLTSKGDKICPTKGATRDLAGVSLVLANPRARLSRSEVRGKASSPIAELCWYLAGSDDLEHIAHYLPKYRESADDGVLLGAYGPRLRGTGDGGQIRRVVEQLRRKPASRQAVIQILRADDLDSGQHDVPCTIALQFVVRQDRVSLVTFMRSNDALWGLPHDVFAFTMLQEIVARELGLEVGPYMHHVGSLHLYEDVVDDAHTFISEGLQPTDQAMPPMPPGDPNVGIDELLQAEAQLRGGEDLSSVRLPSNPYWRDLATMLAVHHALVARQPDTARDLMSGFDDPFYRLFVQDRLDRQESRPS